ncbi:MAG: hypothetical protein EZS28_021337 [Streblomastix strix]|uniref:Uncharacterized protein n=1 Tax=Streblomastix strix TaxID=222440 RepID=A0A5J4VKG4_9EUKA|nr:MAG: hypothetical protein EZS28_021337 [Streblomastix strix]
MTQTETETQFVTLKANNEFELSTQEPWIIRRKQDGFIPKFAKNNSGYFVQKKTGTQIVYLTDSNDCRVDNVILTKQDMKKLLDRDSDNRLIENGYYYTSHLTTDDYTKLWDKYKSWAEDENPNLYKFIFAQEQTDQQIAQMRYGIIKEKPYSVVTPQSVFPQIQVYQPIRTIQPLKSKAKKQAQSITSVNELNELKQQFSESQVQLKAVQSIGLNSRNCQLCGLISQLMPKKSKKMAKDDLQSQSDRHKWYQEIAQKQFPFKTKYEVIRKANYYDIPTHQTKNQFDIYPQSNTLEPHDYQLKPLAKFERPYFSPNYNSWEIDQQFQ